MRLFGGILPFIGWRIGYVDNEGFPSEGVTHWKADLFEIEWLGRGAVLFVGKVYSA